MQKGTENHVLLECLNEIKIIHNILFFFLFPKNYTMCLGYLSQRFRYYTLHSANKIPQHEAIQPAVQPQFCWQVLVSGDQHNC